MNKGFRGLFGITAIPAVYENEDVRHGIVGGKCVKREVNYKEFTNLLAKPGSQISKEVTPSQDWLWKTVMTLSVNVSNIQVNDEYFALCGFGHMDDTNNVKHMITGMVGEIGEIMDVVKSIVIYRKNPITELTKEGKSFKDAFKEEIGDFCFYSVSLQDSFSDGKQPTLEEILNNCYNQIIDVILAFNEMMKEFDPSYSYITIDDCVKDNVNKLSKRYHKLAYSDEQAKERVDKN